MSDAIGARPQGQEQQAEREQHEIVRVVGEGLCHFMVFTTVPSIISKPKAAAATHT